MSRAVPIHRLLLILLLLPAAAMGQFEQGVQVDELSYLDKQYMDQQRASLEGITRSHFGRGFNRSASNDLDLLQLLLDRRLVKESEIQQLQAMGIVLGDVLASELNLHWVVYQDRLGRSRALRDADTDTYLFPVTMISRRREVDNRTPVADIYLKASEIVALSRPKLPYQ